MTRVDPPIENRWRRWIAFAGLTAWWCARFAITRESEIPVVVLFVDSCGPMAVVVGLGQRWFGPWIARAEAWRVVLAAPLLYVGAAFAFALEMMTLVAVFGLETITMSLVFGAFGVACATIVVNPWLTLVGVALTLVATRWAYAPRVLVAPSPTDGPASTTRVAGASES